MLEVAALEVRYGAIRAVRDVSLKLEDGELVALLGAKSSIRCLMC